MNMRLLIVWSGVLFPLLGIACDGGDRKVCERQFGELVTYRTEAMVAAFGELFDTLPEEIQITFVSSKDPQYTRFLEGYAYDSEHKMLFFPFEMSRMKTPSPLGYASYYWPYYEDIYARREYPVIEAVDNVLWGIFLRTAASSQGLTWPHSDCKSVDVGKRLPCEMLVTGIAEYIKQRPLPLFNANRLDRIWPADYAGFTRRVWISDDEYGDVRRYGGILLITPLIKEFGVRRALTYLAKTPFEVEQDDLRGSAKRYQARARQALVW